MPFWKDCGYIKKSESGNGYTLKVKRQTYFIPNDKWEEWIKGESKFALIYERKN